MFKNPIVSIIMSTLNQAAFLSRSVKSVLSQNFQDWELIIINDGSTDNTEKIVKDFQKKKNGLFI